MCPCSCPHPPCSSFPSVPALLTTVWPDCSSHGRALHFLLLLPPCWGQPHPDPLSSHTPPPWARVPRPPPGAVPAPRPHCLPSFPSALPPLSFPPHPGWGAVPGQGREVQEQRPCPVPPPVREWPRKGGVCFSMSHVPPRSCLIPSEQRPGVRPPSAWPSGGGSRCPEPAPGCTTLLFTLALFLSTAC